MRGPRRPNVTLAYSTGHVDIDPHLGAINHLRAGRASFEATAADLLAAEQHVETGVYTWTHIGSVTLAAPDQR